MNDQEKPQDIAWDKFKMDVAKFSAQYEEFLIVAKVATDDPSEDCVYWRSSDKTWGIGAAKRYLNFNLDADTDKLEKE